MKNLCLKVISLFPIFAILVFCSCTCGGDSDDVSDGDDVTTDDTGDDTIDDTADDTTDDTMEDDTADDSSDDTSDDEDPAYSCLWNADLPPDNSYEWVTEKVWDLEYGTGDEQGLFFEEDEPVIYWLEYQEDSRPLYLAKKINGLWQRTCINDESHTVGSLEMIKAPDGTIGIAILGTPTWTDKRLSYCILEDDEIRDCEGITDDIRSTVKLAFQYDGRPGILIKDASDTYLVYYERNAEGIWEFIDLPLTTGDQPRFLAIGSDGEAHYGQSKSYIIPIYHGIVLHASYHLHGTVEQPWTVDFISFGESALPVSDMAVSPGNDIIAAVFDNIEDPPPKVAHQVRRNQWEIIQIASDKAGASGVRVGYDHDENAIVGYGLQDGINASICFSRWEDGLWRKEVVEDERELYINFENVMDMNTDSNGNIGLLYIYVQRDNDHNDRSLMFARRVPKYTLHPAEADK